MNETRMGMRRKATTALVLLVVCVLMLPICMTADKDTRQHAPGPGTPGFIHANSGGLSSVRSQAGDPDSRSMRTCPLMAKPFVLTESDKHERHGPDRAFDGSNSPDDFWETRGSFPFWLQIKYRSSRTVSRYSLAGGEKISRMPTAWQLQGSSNGGDWVVLDTRSEQTTAPHKTLTRPLRH